MARDGCALPTTCGRPTIRMCSRARPRDLSHEISATRSQPRDLSHEISATRSHVSSTPITSLPSPRVSPCSLQACHPMSSPMPSHAIICHPMSLPMPSHVFANAIPCHHMPSHVFAHAIPCHHMPSHASLRIFHGDPCNPSRRTICEAMRPWYRSC